MYTFLFIKSYNKKYISYLQNRPNLSAEEEYNFFINRFDINNYEILITSHAKLVIKEAKIYQRYTSISTEDLIQEGMLGLMRAIEKFEITHGARFSCYAKWWVKAFIQEYILSFLYTIKNQKKRQDLLAEYQETQKYINGNSTPTEGKHSENGMVTSISLDSEKFHEVFADPDTNIEEEEIENLLFQKRLDWLIVAMNELSPIEHCIITEMFLNKRIVTLAEVSEKLGIAPPKVKMIVLKSLRKLRSVLVQRTEQLQHYF